MDRDIDDVAETLRKDRTRQRRCSLLIGSGCSVTAGIPSARGFVDIIRKQYPRAYNRAIEKTYSKCMAQLSVGERRELISTYVDNAKINWAHICIAQLMKCGYVDRILTTNFDLLAVRACALLGLFPAIYDLAASQLFRPADIPDQAVFYLHGQRTGFVLINTEDEFRHHFEFLAPVFEDAGQEGRIWVVLGYSGTNDPVFEQLAKIPRFDYNLYWVGHGDDEPPQHVRERLLVEGKYAFYVRGFDADSFLITLAQKLECFPPDLISKPFSYLDSLLDTISTYTLPGEQAPGIDVTESPRKLIRTALSHLEAPVLPMEKALALPSVVLSQELMWHLMSGEYDNVISLAAGYQPEKLPEISLPLMWAYLMKGTRLSAQAETKTGEERDRLFAQAAEKYEAALKIRPDMAWALSN
jgi:hypothetical protein